MWNRGWDLLLCVGVALVGLLIGELPDVARVWQIIFAIPLIFILPGYALSWLVFPNPNHDGVERILISVGTSIIGTILCGLLLNAASIGLEAREWRVMLTLITVVAAFAALRSRGNEGIGGQWLRTIQIPEVVLLTLAALISVGAFVAVKDAASSRASAFTQLWILPDDTEIQIGVHNQERERVHYRLVLRDDQDQILQEWTDIELETQEQWVQIVPITASVNRYKAFLYRVPEPQVYRFVFWSLN